MKKDVFANELTMEVVVGVFIVLLMVGLTYFTFVMSGSKWGKQTESIEVVFQNVMGLRERDTVMVRGMPVGEVKTLRLEPNGVHVNLEVSEPLDMREDYAISIVPSSVFGGRYVRVYEGTSAEALPLSFSFIGQEPTDLMDDAAEVMNAARKDLTGDGGGDIRSSLPRETCDRCGARECVCDRRELPQDEADRGAYNAAIDGIESLLLALAVEGVITGENTDRADNAIRTAMDALANR